MPSLPNARIDQLGERLRLDPVSAEDLVLLQELIAEFDGPMAAVQARLSQEVSIETTSRLKTRDTLVDKLRRQRTRLSTIQDIAGLRVVADMSLQEQNAMRTKIESLFPGCAVQDRRVAPSFGYRAVHVIALQDGYRVEIQVRTYLQDLWAQVIERLADAWGRGIRSEKVLRTPRRWRGV